MLLLLSASVVNVIMENASEGLMNEILYPVDLILISEHM